MLGLDRDHSAAPPKGLPLATRLSLRIAWERSKLAQRILPPASAVVPPAQGLAPLHVAACMVVPSREAMIREHLPKHAVVAEVGVAAGANASTILKGAQPQELHLIDRDLSHVQRDFIEPGLRDGVVRLYEQDSAIALASFEDEYFDWIYIDGDHSYPGVMRDIEQAKRKVKRDGLLVFNDYILFSHITFDYYGVVAAVHELCCDDGWAFRYLALETRGYFDVALSRANAP